MAKFSRIDVYNMFYKQKAIPMFYNESIDDSIEIIKACYKGGMRVFEFLNRGDQTLNIFTRLLTYCHTQYNDCILGVGSIVDALTTAWFIQTGADFIVSPLLNAEMAFICNRRKVPWIPGCGTVSEIGRAEELGAEIIKIFPANTLGGSAFIKALKGPCPWSSVMPSGGIMPNKESLTEWFLSGACCVGLGGQFITKEIIEKKQFQQLTKKTKEIMEGINGLTF